RQPDQNHHAHVRPRRTRNRRRRHLGRRLQRRIQGLENLGRNRRHPKPLHPGDPLSNRLKNIAPKVAKNVTAKIVTLDIERIPGRASVKHRGLTIEGEFWDLNGWKHTIGRRIHADDVQEWPRTICAAWRWYGDDEVHFAAEWEVGGHEGFLRRLWDVADECDIAIGHNAGGFDFPILASDWAMLGLPAPSPFKVIDTLKVARSAFSMPSNTLDSLAKRLGVESKSDKYDVQVAQAAVAG